MATHNVLILNKVAAQTNPALNRSAYSASALDNGWVFNLQEQNTTVTGATEVWNAKQPATGSLIGLWMAASPEVVLSNTGTSYYRGINPDPRNFYTSASTVFDAFKPMPGDIITLTADALDSTTEQAFAVAAVTNFEFTWAAAPAGTSTMCLRYLSTTYISIGSGAIDNQRVEAYKFEVLYN